jgi:ribonucleoside-diphosphate reductase alpha chain
MFTAAEQRLSDFLWSTRYRDNDAQPAERTIEDTWARLAGSAAAIEPRPADWSERFLGILRNFAFLPGGRILAGAGTRHRVTLANCFVMGAIDDSVEGIFESLKEGALTMQQGGGVGYDFSTLRPRGARARTTGMVASGPVSFLRVWDATCATILSTGARRGAMMATLRCDHPDIEEFIDAKREPGALRHFNLSVLVSDAFMQAVQDDREWPLVFPAHDLSDGANSALVERPWSGQPEPVACRVYRTLRARDLWQRLCESAYECAEPGVLFIDRINAENNLGYCETLSATNPCAEEPLPPFGACNLGSLNLTAFVRKPFTERARLDHESIAAVVPLAIRFLDNVLEITRFPLMRQREEAHRSRRVGLGITGLADALAMLGLRYDSEAARQAAAGVMELMRDAAYRASVELARARGPFQAFERTRYAARPFIRRLPGEVQADIYEHGIRNSHLLAIAPAGAISLLAGNVSSGIEPIFGIETLRQVLDGERKYCNFQVVDYAYALWRAAHPGQQLPEAFLDREAVNAHDHLLMQAALQPFVDGGIAKTIALARNAPKASVARILREAHELHLKGCTIFREGARRAVIEGGTHRAAEQDVELSTACCDIERENE